jgi:hypothetical protein
MPALDDVGEIVENPAIWADHLRAALVNQQLPKNAKT